MPDLRFDHFLPDRLSCRSGAAVPELAAGSFGVWGKTLLERSIL
jgi:hypothetical protein